MKSFCKAWAFLALLLTFTSARGQLDLKTAVGGGLYRVVKSSNGQSFLICQSAGSTVNTDVYFRMGPIYEFDSISGISLLLNKIIDTHIGAALRSGGRDLKYYSSLEPEQIGYHFESDAADLDYILKLVNEKIVQANFDDEGLDEAKAEFRYDLDSVKKNPAQSSAALVMKKLWGNDFRKLNIYGDRKNYAEIRVADLKAFHTKYFLPFNNAICLTGTFDNDKLVDLLRETFKDFKSKEFNPELITNVIDFKPVVNNLQLMAYTKGKDRLTMSYQNPGARQDRNASYCAFILTQLMNDPAGRIQKAVQAEGLRHFKAAYTCYNFYGSLELSAEPSGDNINKAFQVMAALIDTIRLKNYFNKEEIAQARQSIATEFDNLKNNQIRDFMSLVNRYRFSNDENYFTGMVDSLGNVTVGFMRQYVNDYFSDHCAIRCYYTTDTATGTDTTGQRYFPLDGSVADMVFSYALNKTDIEGAEAGTNLQRLIQWLRINPDIHVQINGFADQGEFTKAYDDSVKRFIDSTSTFHKAMPDAFKKGYLRIEFMRAMKIAKAIYEAGISEDRITGTSMVFSSETAEGAAANRKCTISLEKIKPRMSLYEYHFGKKKAEEESSMNR